MKRSLLPGLLLLLLVSAAVPPLRADNLFYNGRKITVLRGLMYGGKTYDNVQIIGWAEGGGVLLMTNKGEVTVPVRACPSLWINALKQRFPRPQDRPAPSSAEDAVEEEAPMPEADEDFSEFEDNPFAAPSPPVMTESVPGSVDFPMLLQALEKAGVKTLRDGDNEFTSKDITAINPAEIRYTHKYGVGRMHAMLLPDAARVALGINAEAAAKYRRYVDYRKKVKAWEIARTVQKQRRGEALPTTSKDSAYKGDRTVHVDGYRQKDGTYVKPHTRRAPKP